MAGQEQLELEQEFLRAQLEESREALAQKIERLEEKVAENVENATASVADATASVMESVQNASESVTQTVDNVTGAVQGTVDSVCQSLEDTVVCVKQVFDWRQQFEKHPYLVLAGAVAVGYVGGRLFSEASARRSVVKDRNVSATARMVSVPKAGFHSSESPPLETVNGQSSNGFHSDMVTNGLRTNGIPQETNDSRPLVEPSRSFWANVLGETVGGEAETLQRIAIKLALGSLRDVLVGSVPKPVQQPIAEALNDLTEKLGASRSRVRAGSY